MSLGAIFREIKGLVGIKQVIYDSVDPFTPSWWDKWEEATTEAQEIVYALVGKRLVQLKMEGRVRNSDKSPNIPFHASFKCSVLEIDGEIVPEKEREEKAQRFESSSNIPETFERYRVFLKSLESFGIHGTPITVSDDYVDGHLKIVRLRQRLLERR